jgi:cytochrome c-type biogenesis protein CcmH/NrfG
MAEASSQENADSARMAINNALTAINQATRLDPKLPEAWLFKGMILMAGKQDQKGAVEAWEHYLTIAPPDADTTRIATMVRGFRRQNR